MFQQKIPKSQKQDKTLYDKHYYHDVSNKYRDWDLGNFIQIISIDPCKSKLINFAFRVERRFDNGIVQTIMMKNITDGISNDIYNSITDFLDENIEYINKTHIFIIERQLPYNYKAVRISQHVITYLMVKTKNNSFLPEIIEVDSKLKSKQLNAPANLSSKGIKKWSVEKAISLLNKRNDQYGLDLLDELKNKKQKLDDYCDTICQAEAYISLINL